MKTERKVIILTIIFALLFWVVDGVTYHHISSDDGKTWQRQPGLLAARLYGKAQKDIDETINLRDYLRVHDERPR